MKETITVRHGEEGVVVYLELAQRLGLKMGPNVSYEIFWEIIRLLEIIARLETEVEDWKRRAGMVDMEKLDRQAEELARQMQLEQYRIVVEAEREACAKIAEEGKEFKGVGRRYEAEAIAERIRARSKEK